MRDLTSNPLQHSRRMTSAEWDELLVRQKRSIKRLKSGRSHAQAKHAKRAAPLLSLHNWQLPRLTIDERDLSLR